MWRRSRLRSIRGGIVLDVVIAAGLILIAAFLLASLGVTWAQFESGVERFFGL